MEDSELRVRELFAPEALDVFLQETWQRAPILIRRQTLDFYGGRISGRDVPDIVGLAGRLAESRAEVLPVLQLVGGELAAGEVKLRTPARSTAGILGAYKNGSSILVQEVHRYWPALAQLCRDLEQTLRSPVNTTLIHSPPNAQAFGRHFDVADGLILQLSGEKHWRVFDSGAQLPLEAFPPLPFETDGELIQWLRNATHRGQNLAPALVFDNIVRAGDLLYVPRGFEHEVWTSQSPSSHIVIAVQAVTYCDLILAGLRRFIERDIPVRRRLPSRRWESGARREMREKVRELVEAFSQSFDADQAIDNLVGAYDARRDAWSAFPSGLDGGGDDAADVTLGWSLEHVAVHRGTLAVLENAVELTYGDRRFLLPPQAGEALAFIVKHPRFVAADLPGLSDASRLVLCRRLLRARILRRCETFSDDNMESRHDQSASE